MSRVYSVRVPSHLSALAEERGGASWIREQVVALLEGLAGTPERQVSREDLAGPKEPIVSEPDADYEQRVRDRFGYASSETRTERERSDAAARMVNRDPDEYWLAGHPPSTENLLPPGAIVPVPRPEYMLSEEQYVQSELSITKSQLDSGRLRDHDGRTLQRSEAYLRWRYSAFMAGEVAAL